MPTVRPRWWLLALGIALGTAAIGTVVLWLLPTLLVPDGTAGTTAAERLKAQNDVRTALIAFLVAVAGTGTLAFTGNTYVLNRRGQQVDRYTAAVGQLDDDYAPTRIGAVHALGRVGADSALERDAVIRVLAAFVRLQSHQPHAGGPDRVAEDVQAALDALAPLLGHSSPRADLRGADLTGADLSAIREDRALVDDDTALPSPPGFGPPATADRGGRS